MCAKGLKAEHIEPVDDPPRVGDASTRVRSVDSTAVAWARKAVRDRAAVGGTFTWPALHKGLQTAKLIADDVSVHKVRRALIAEGFAVYQTRSAPPMDMTTDYWHRQRERFALGLAEALEEERRGDAVLVASDESFVNLHHRRHITVADSASNDVVPTRRGAPRAVVRMNSGRGSLIIIKHAITRDGWLTAPNEDGLVGPARLPPNKRSGPTTNAECVYASSWGGDDAGDYHNHWDGANELKWAKEQLFPAFRALYGHDKKMVLILDNSKNHRCMPATYCPPTSASTKSRLIAALQTAGVMSIDVVRTETVGVGKAKRKCEVGESRAASTWHLSGRAGVSADELRAALKAAYTTNPALTRNQLEQLFYEGVRLPPPISAF